MTPTHDTTHHLSPTRTGKPMDAVALALTRCYLAVVAPPRRDDRGDVPGWVLITVMTAGLVTIIWQLARGELTSMLRSALNSVS